MKTKMMGVIPQRVVVNFCKSMGDKGVMSHKGGPIGGSAAFLSRQRMQSNDFFIPDYLGKMFFPIHWKKKDFGKCQSFKLKNSLMNNYHHNDLNDINQ